MRGNLILLISLLLFYACNKKSGTKPLSGSISESVYASGFVKAENQYTVVSSIPGTLIKVHTKVGEKVSKGDPLFTIKNTVGEYNVGNARLALKKAEESKTVLSEMERRLKVLEAKYNQDSLMFERQKNLFEKEVGTEVQLEQAKLAFISSQAEYRNLISQLNQARINYRLDKQMAENSVKIAEENVEGYIVRSEINGTVFTIYPQVGEVIGGQTALGVIGQKDSFLLEFQVDENDIAKVKTGQKVLVSMDSYQDSVFQAQITRIFPIMDAKTGTFTVEGEFTVEPPKMYPYLNLEANILVNHKNNALVIPREYLVDNEYVMLESGEKVKVRIGLKNYEYAEILEGLNNDQTITKP